MIRSSLGIALLMGACPFAANQDLPSQGIPKIHLVLPPEIASEGAEISYIMTGSFGGWGSYVKTEKGQSTYEIVAAVKGAPAEEVKVIAYLPGCQIETLDVVVHEQEESLQLQCVPLPQIVLRGWIDPSKAVSDSNEIVVRYLAFWSHGFFNIMDGLVTQFEVTRVDPDQDGHFEVALPDFRAQANLGQAEFQFILREKKSWNLRYELRPDVESAGIDGLKTGASYPSLIRFVAVPLD